MKKGLTPTPQQGQLFIRAKRSPCLVGGFTMIEIIAAIFVITVGAMGVFGLVQQAVSIITISSSRLVATYLAQEGIEIVRNIRDGNFLKIHNEEEGVSWDDDLSENEHYNFDYRSQSIPDNSNCSGKNYLVLSGGFYICLSDTNVKFQRKIAIDKSIPDKIGVSVEVSWQERGRTHQVRAQENLYHWY